ncbi:hypothetical protein CEW87_02210 [Parazoarcus communis]|uniref:Uncharacterized protein n=1 Tax=Parazoarcus communis TaxID=41977 RepID=A0A2U8GZ88_9RHOO|nr:OadG family transporter subunit [Parazoarcus communis]AWI78266.1 hypothetical protein CEW87_02210 [Parazoarcus communis]
MSVTDTLAFILTGFSVVLIALSLLWLVSALIGRLFAVAAPRPSAVAAVAPLAAGPSPAAPGIPAAHVAAITAAVAVMTGGRGRVVSVRAPAHLAVTWAREGRTEQFSSHRVRWDWAIPGPPHVDYDAPAQDPAPAQPPVGRHQ